MDFRRLARSLPKPNPDQPLNNTSGGPASLTELPPNILDALVPGYSVISRHILASFGVDISLFVSIAVLTFAIFKGGQIVSRRLYKAFRYLLISSVHIDEGDDLYDMLMDWLSATQLQASKRSVRAKTKHGAREEVDADVSNSMSADGLFDYNKWSARTPPQYQPYYGSNYIWHGGRPFFFSIIRKQREAQTVQMRWGGGHTEDNLIQIDCIGRSIQPIRELLRAAKVWSLERQKNNTIIRHPTPKDRARFGGAWSRTFSRPSRPMSTVILDTEQKQMIIKDMNEYLHPASPKWYATRGIPYRRGYLFHGPPGTGKTSLSFALAGIFGLDIYCISLQEPTLTESDLMQLFSTLQRRCIVLLEDVDAAGLIRDEQSDGTEGEGGDAADGKKRTKKQGGNKGNVKDKNKKKEGKKDSETNDDLPNGVNSDDEPTLKDLAEELKSLKTLTNELKSNAANPNPSPSGPKGGRSPHPTREPGTGISLSGLLNAIDGVASHEGRVLIMTTNHPDQLDAALVRPGRVDRRVGFRLAGRRQVRELFERMYAAGSAEAGEVRLAAGGDAARTAENEETELSRGEVEALARQFAAQVPADTFTPAEIQNHLMRFKKEPGAAVARVGEWMRETRKGKEGSGSEDGG